MFRHDVICVATPSASWSFFASPLSPCTWLRDCGAERALLLDCACAARDFDSPPSVKADRLKFPTSFPTRNRASTLEGRLGTVSVRLLRFNRSECSFQYMRRARSLTASCEMLCFRACPKYLGWRRPNLSQCGCHTMLYYTLSCRQFAFTVKLHNVPCLGKGLDPNDLQIVLLARGLHDLKALTPQKYFTQPAKCPAPHAHLWVQSGLLRKSCCRQV